MKNTTNNKTIDIFELDCSEIASKIMKNTKKNKTIDIFELDCSEIAAKIMKNYETCQKNDQK